MPRATKKSSTKGSHKRVEDSTQAPGLFSQRGVASATPSKGELKHVKWDSVELEQLNPLLQRQFIVGGDIMIARVLLKRGCVVPEHRHVNEQVTYILEGALKLMIDGREIVVHAGEVLTIPPNMPHAAEALLDTVDLDVFNPPRADWINKDDRYLRGPATPIQK